MKFWSLNRQLRYSHGGLNGVVRDLVGILNLANAVGGDAVLVSTEKRGRPNLPDSTACLVLVNEKTWKYDLNGSFLISTVHFIIICIIDINWQRSKFVQTCL